MERRKPKVSVSLPAFNGERYILSAVESVLDQSFQDFELIVCDDDSTDSTWGIVSGIHDERVYSYRNTKRLGLVGNWNRSVQLGRGELVVLMHQDDLMCPKNLALKVAFLDTHPCVGFVHSNVCCIDEKGNDIGGHWLPQPEIDYVVPGIEVLERLMCAGNIICCPSVMVRRECLQRAGGFDSRLPFTADMEMWLRLSNLCDVGYLATPLIHYRIHSNQETQKFGEGREIIEVGRAIQIALDEHLQLPATASLRWRARFSLVRWALRQAQWKVRTGQNRQALKYISAAASVGFGRFSVPQHAHTVRKSW